MQRGGWMAEPRHCADTLKEDTPAGSHARSVGAGSKRRSVGAKRRSSSERRISNLSNTARYTNMPCRIQTEHVEVCAHIYCPLGRTRRAEAAERARESALRPFACCCACCSHRRSRRPSFAVRRARHGFGQQQPI